MQTHEAMMITLAEPFNNDGQLSMRLTLGDPDAREDVFLSQASLSKLIEALEYNWLPPHCGIAKNLERQIVLVEWSRGRIVRIGDPFGHVMVEVTDLSLNR